MNKKVSGRPAKDIGMRKYGVVTALQPTDKRDRGSIIWKCRCNSCGGLQFISASRLVHKATRIKCKGECIKEEPCPTTSSPTTPES